MSYALPTKPYLGTIEGMKKLLTALSLITLFCASSAYAQIDFNFDGSADDEDDGPKVINPYDDKYKPDITIDDSESGASLLPNYFYHVGFVRKPGSTADDLNMVIASPGSITGCLEMDNPTVKTVKVGTAMRLEITDGFIDVDRNTVRYFHYECKPGTSTSHMNITLSKEQLREDGIEKLTIVSEEIGAFNDITLDIQDTHVTITSEVRDLSQFGLPIPPTPGSEITYWNFPENTISLFSSDADLHDDEAMKAARALARKQGLTPLDEIISGFKPNHMYDDKLYVVDVEGRFNENLKEQNDVFALGTIQQPELYFGPQGAYNKPVEKTVYARRPGLYE